MNRPVFIYGLYTDKDNTIMYVGITKRSVKIRLREHINESKRINSSTKHKWILRNINNINIRLIEICKKSNFIEREKYWIDKLSKNTTLVNTSTGGEIGYIKVDFCTYDECKNYIKNKNIKTANEWRIFIKNNNIPVSIPRKPSEYYIEFKSWSNFLDSDNLSYNLLSKGYLEYEDCKRWVNKNINVSSLKEWRKIDRKKLPHNIPKTPNAIYKNNGWISWYSFLEYSNEVKHISYEEAKEWIKNNLKFNNVNDWLISCSENIIPNFISTSPHTYYKSRGWISWYDFLNLEKISPDEYISYEEAKKWLLNNKEINSSTEFRRLARLGEIPKFISNKPDAFYSKKNRGWVNWSDFLNNKRIGKNSKDYISYENARIWVKNNLSINNTTEWFVNVKNNKIPEFISNEPYKFYSKKDRGWISWYDFLVKEKTKYKVKD